MTRALPKKGCWGFYTHSPIEVTDTHLLLCNLAKRMGTLSISAGRPEVLEWRDMETCDSFNQGYFSCDYEFGSVLEAAVALHEFRMLRESEALP